MPDTQQHPLKNKSFFTIHVNGNHQYWTDDDLVKRPSVTGLSAFTDSDAFGAGMGYAIKEAEETGNPQEARVQVKLAIDIGTDFHSHVDNYIKTGAISEDPVFMCWYNEIAVNREFIASETLVYHPSLKYGGTADAFSLEALGPDGEDKVVLWDWKTVNRDSWEKVEGYGPNRGKQRGSSLRWIKDHAQVAGYAKCLKALDSVLEVDAAFICYVMRDGSYAVTELVDLAFGERVFDISRDMYLLQKEVK